MHTLGVKNIWCADFEEKGRHRALRIMLGVTLILLPVAVFSVGVVKMASSSQKSIPRIPQAEQLIFDDMREHADHDLLQDKTSCIPTQASYISLARARRALSDSLPDFETYKGNVSDEIVWEVPAGRQEEVQFLPVRTPGNHIKARMKLNQTAAITKDLDMVGDTEHKSKGLQNSRESETAPLDILDYTDIDNKNKIKPHIIYDDAGGEGGSQDLDQSEHQEEDKFEKGPIRDQLSSDCMSSNSQQHAYWKGEGDVKTIREEQSRLMKMFMDTTADPCDDFYQFACGNWGSHNPIPKDKAAFDTFEVLRESLDTVLKDLLEADPTSDDPEPYVKTKNLYRSCMNEEMLEHRREKPLMELLDSLGGWPIISPCWNQSNFDWLELMARLRLYNNDILISEWVGPDIKNSDEYVIQFDQTSLGLPTREYYLQAVNFVYLQAYRDYMVKIATLLGADPLRAASEADDVISFETALAEITAAPDERRNVSELYKRMTVGELRAFIPQIDWQLYLTIVTERQINHSEPVVIFALRYMQDLVYLLSQTPPRTISNYLLWRFVRHRVNNLDDRFQEAKQKFYYILFGREQSPPRWKNCVTQVNSNLGMAVGAMFVHKYFDEKSKNDTLIMTTEIQQSFQEILSMTTWIDDETKSLAAEKVQTMMLRIGYPDYILDHDQLSTRYRDVEIDPDKYFENTLNILRHLTRVEQNNLGCRVNKTLWNTAPAVVNAYYSRNKNQIMVPAGILQPPFYHRYFPRSLNYGGIGVVIGHEITHGFDDKGRLFDKNGNLHRWWREEAINNFHERARCLIEQYSKYTVQEVGIQIDGINTQGENIADNGGIKEAFRAYKHWLHKHGCADETLPGLNATGMQLFFLNFAQVWCGNTRPEATRNKLKTAVHSPGKFRVIGTLTNSEDFAKVFKCPLGSPMNPKKKCSVW
ncbi:neprilysin-4-like isoform X2 [Macrosteles quadrilineatus]|uniref:neprilysin-4-like isoform X2 n=1 Tax=Macrosteles quadrilineatus TaxID=74068 RepID=UPI0023E1CFE7|nr:neprilysin-4-like isoform X2 [Macrosteles quadrilineatus]